jgi:DNA/RNA endonuclease YhcR with UshA esterase domain
MRKAFALTMEMGIATGFALLTLLTFAPAMAAEKPVTPISEITTKDTGKILTVEGEIAGSRSFKGGMRYVLKDKDNAGEITLVIFDRVLKQMPQRAGLLDGAVVNVTGKIDFFNEEAQIVPARKGDVVIVTAAPQPETFAVQDLGDAEIGKTVAVSGTVIEVSNFSAGFKLNLADDTGDISVVLFENVWDGLKAPEKVNAGAVLSVTGKLNEYKNALEIAPASSESVLVVAAPAMRDVPTKTLGAINGNDHNAVVRVDGEVVAIDPFENGVNVLVKDETGAQKLRLYNVVAKRVKLSAGDKISVIGRVVASRSRGIVIDVAMPGDIEVKK